MGHSCATAIKFCFLLVCSSWAEIFEAEPVVHFIKLITGEDLYREESSGLGLANWYWFIWGFPCLCPENPISQETSQS